MNTELIKKYVDERAKWIAAGKPLRNEERIKELFQICKDCPSFIRSTDIKGKCRECGCGLKEYGSVLNKLAWSTTKCPLKEPKWKEEAGFEQIEVTEEEIQKIEAEAQKKKTGCGCGKR